MLQARWFRDDDSHAEVSMFAIEKLQCNRSCNRVGPWDGSEGSRTASTATKRDVRSISCIQTIKSSKSCGTGEVPMRRVATSAVVIMVKELEPASFIGVFGIN